MALSFLDYIDPGHFVGAKEAWISEGRVFVELDDHPNRECLLTQIQALSLPQTIIEEGTILARVDLISKEDKQLIIELKLTAVLVPQLVHTVKELEEHL